MIRKLIWMIPAAILGILIFSFLGGEIVMRLWNWLAPELFGFRQVTFWQALGLLALCRILFGGVGLGGRSRRSHGERRLRERWGQMTPEERDRFRRGLHHHPDPTSPLDAKPSA